MTKVVAFSARKSGGKDTSANFLLGTVMKKLSFIADFKVTDKGKLYCFGWANQAASDGVFDYDAQTQFVSSFKKNYLDKHIKLYSFADCLKKDICMKMFGLTYEQCYGTDEQKNTLTHLRWEDMPGVVTPFVAATVLCDMCGDGSYPKNLEYNIPSIMVHDEGVMTAREFMQFGGTEIFRKMCHDCHVNATNNQIEIDSPEIAVIRDARFVNEVDGTREKGGYVVRLLRDPNDGNDKHESETALDDYPLENYFAVIDNREMSVAEQNDAIREALFPILDLS